MIQRSFTRFQIFFRLYHVLSCNWLKLLKSPSRPLHLEQGSGSRAGPVQQVLLQTRALGTRCGRCDSARLRLFLVAPLAGAVTAHRESTAFALGPKLRSKSFSGYYIRLKRKRWARLCSPCPLYHLLLSSFYTRKYVFCISQEDELPHPLWVSMPPAAEPTRSGAAAERALRGHRDIAGGF